jgi:hypothetical protein
MEKINGSIDFGYASIAFEYNFESNLYHTTMSHSMRSTLHFLSAAQLEWAHKSRSGVSITTSIDASEMRSEDIF